MTNKYSSATSAIIPGPGTMFNEITHIKPTKNRVNENTNTYAITVPVSVKRKTACEARPKGFARTKSTKTKKNKNTKPKKTKK